MADYPQMFFLKRCGGGVVVVMNPLENMIKPTDLPRKKVTYKVVL